MVLAILINKFGSKKIPQKFEALKNEAQKKPSFEREVYTRRLLGILFFIFVLVSLPIAYIAEKMLDMTGYETCTIAGIAAVALAAFVSEAKAAQKFDKKSEKK